MRPPGKQNYTSLLELGAVVVRPLGGRQHGQRRLQREVQHRLGRQLDLLALGCRLDATSEPASCRSANRRALSATGDTADDGANRRARADFGRGVLASRGALAMVLVRLQAVVLGPDGNSIELEYQQRLAREFARALDIDHVTFDVVSGGNCDITLDRQR